MADNTMTPVNVFLSASVPQKNRNPIYWTGNPLLIQSAVIALVTEVVKLPGCLLVFGGHPSITRIIAEVANFRDSLEKEKIVLFQSEFFKTIYPEDNKKFKCLELVPSVPEDPSASLSNMRSAMLEYRPFNLGVFIGGMEGVECEEFDKFCNYHKNAKVIMLGSTGGAARILWEKHQDFLKGQWRNDQVVEDMRYDKGYAPFFRTCLASAVNQL